jgi:hypothetical protein
LCVCLMHFANQAKDPQISFFADSAAFHWYQKLGLTSDEKKDIKNSNLDFIVK